MKTLLGVLSFVCFCLLAGYIGGWDCGEPLTFSWGVIGSAIGCVVFAIAGGFWGIRGDR